MDRQPVGAAPQVERPRQTAQPQQVIQVPMGQQNLVQPPEAQSAGHQLALGSLAAIDQETVASMLHQQG